MVRPQIQRTKGRQGESTEGAKDTGLLTLPLPVNTRLKNGSVCINRALNLKGVSTKFSEDDMELDGVADGENDNDVSNSEALPSHRDMLSIMLV